MWYLLCARVLKGNTTVFYQFNFDIVFLSRTLVSVVNNFAPLCTVVLDYFMLSEKLVIFKIFQLFTAFGRALLMILFTPLPEFSNKSTHEGASTLWTAIKYGMLDSKSSFGGIPVLVAICYISGGDLSAWRDFEAIGWICVVSLSITVISSQTFRFKAFWHEETSKLQPL